MRISHLVLWMQKSRCVLSATKQSTDSFECLSELFKLKALNLSQNQTLLQKRSRTFILKGKKEEVIVSNSDGKFRSFYWVILLISFILAKYS